jgi:hypothetical protein
MIGRERRRAMDSAVSHNLPRKRGSYVDDIDDVVANLFFFSSSPTVGYRRPAPVVSYEHPVASFSPKLPSGAARTTFDCAVIVMFIPSLKDL